MGAVALFEAAGTSATTTTGFVLASTMPQGQPVLFAECDPSGGDLAAWAGLADTPGWATAVAGGDRSWNGLRTHLQQLPSGLSVLTAPTRSRVARTVVREAAARFGTLLGSINEVVTIADCGRVDGTDLPVWAGVASLVLLVVRQSPASPGATVARIDRAAETIGRLSSVAARVGVVVVGTRPYDPEELIDAVGGELFGVLAEDPIGAGLAAGAWTVGKGAARSALVRSARPIAAAITETLAAPADVVAVESRIGAAG
jgi:hypothetical protein